MKVYAFKSILEALGDLPPFPGGHAVRERFLFLYMGAVSTSKYVPLGKVVHDPSMGWVFHPDDLCTLLGGTK